MHPAKDNAVFVSLLEQNPLAQEHILYVLKRDRTIRVLRFEQLESGDHSNLPPLIFVIDSFGLPLPLSELLRRLGAGYTRAKYIVLVLEHSDKDTTRLLHLGIHGFVAYSEVSHSLVRAIHSVFDGRLWIRPEVLQEYVEQNALVQPRYDVTTLREGQIIELVKQRLSNKEIAKILNLRESTVKFHLSNIFSKLQLVSRRDLIDKGESSLNCLKPLFPHDIARTRH